MKLVDWLDKNEIRWFPIKIRLENGKKVPQRTDGFETYEEWVDTWNPTDDDIVRMKQGAGTCNAIAIDTSKIHQFDVDCVQPFIHVVRRSGPWFPSFTKKLPHAFYTTNKPTGNPISNHEIWPNVEKLEGRWAFGPIDANVFNENLKVPEY